MFGNHNLLARTGQRHTINVIRTTIEKFSAGPSILSATALLVSGSGHINADSSFFVDNLGVGFRMFDGRAVQIDPMKPVLKAPGTLDPCS